MSAAVKNKRSVGWTGFTRICSQCTTYLYSSQSYTYSSFRSTIVPAIRAEFSLFRRMTSPTESSLSSEVLLTCVQAALSLLLSTFETRCICGHRVTCRSLMNATTEQLYTVYRREKQHPCTVHRFGGFGTHESLLCFRQGLQLKRWKECHLQANSCREVTS